MFRSNNVSTQSITGNNRSRGAFRVSTNDAMMTKATASTMGDVEAIDSGRCERLSQYEKLKRSDITMQKSTFSLLPGPYKREPQQHRWRQTRTEQYPARETRSTHRCIRPFSSIELSTPAIPCRITESCQRYEFSGQSSPAEPYCQNRQ